MCRLGLRRVISSPTATEIVIRVFFDVLHNSASVMAKFVGTATRAAGILHSIKPSEHERRLLAGILPSILPSIIGAGGSLMSSPLGCLAGMAATPGQ